MFLIKNRNEGITQIVEKNEKVLLITHRADYDGKFAGLFAWRGLSSRTNNLRVIGYDYEDDFLSILRANPEHKKLIFTDIHPEGLTQGDYDRLHEEGYTFSVIDHHISFLNDKDKIYNMDFVFGGDQRAACWWSYLLFIEMRDLRWPEEGDQKKDMVDQFETYIYRRAPILVKMLEQHDRWEEKGVRFESQNNRYCLQEAMREFERKFGNIITLLEQDRFQELTILMNLVNDVIEGKVITEDDLTFELKPGDEPWGELDDAFKKFSEAWALGKVLFGTLMSSYENIAKEHAVEVVFEGKTWICINSSTGNSLLFNSVFDPDRHYAMLKWSLKKHGKFGYTMYLPTSYITEERRVDLIAKKHGGGGHKGAAGFVVEDHGFYTNGAGSLDLVVIDVQREETNLG